MMPSHANAIAPRPQQCINDVADWCGSRRLQLNDPTTEFDVVWFIGGAEQADMTIIKRRYGRHTTSDDGSRSWACT